MSNSSSSRSGPLRQLAFAADFPTLDEAQPVCRSLRGEVGTIKVGLELFTRYGPPACALAEQADAALFLDLKLHDIPATVGRAVASASRLGATWLTVHAAGGRAMLAAAVEAAGSGLNIVAVTVLTSLDDDDLSQQNIAGGAADQVLRLARLSWQAGVRAFVCSPLEAASLRAALGPEATLITPGIRPTGSQTADQKRVCTPADAIAAGADLLVVGRPIRQASDPVAAARGIVRDIQSLSQS